MEAILKATRRQRIPINPAVVISNNPEAAGLKIAQGFGVSTAVLPSKDFGGTRWEYDQRLISILQKHGVTQKNGLVCLAGFMRIISPQFIRKYKNRILNIHPAILPAFPGLHAQRQALHYGVKFSGCTVHFVDDCVDTGPIVLQAVVKVNDDDTEETLSRRILAKEHVIYPMAVKLFAEGRIKIFGRRVIIKSRAR